MTRDRKAFSGENTLGYAETVRFRRVKLIFAVTLSIMLVVTMMPAGAFAKSAPVRKTTGQKTMTAAEAAGLQKGASQQTPQGEDPDASADPDADAKAGEAGDPQAGEAESFDSSQAEDQTMSEEADQPAAAEPDSGVTEPEGRRGFLLGAGADGSASGGFPYQECSWNGTEVTTTTRTHEASPVPSNGKMTSGWYYLNNSVTVDGRISISGDTNLILGDGYTLDVKGLHVPKGTTLTVYGQSSGKSAGKIYSHPSGGAAIGAYSGHKGGNIVIHGGRIEAYGHDHCAGIGGNDDDRKDIGSITIYGGDIMAEGGNSGAGIGGGRACEGGNINIYGGVVNAVGGHYGAGIGGGNGQETNPMRGAHGGTITIWGGDVTARGGDDGAGIGGGEGGNAGTITINGGKVNATGGNNSSGIGCGEGESTGVGGTVTINGGEVTAWGGGDAAGIGGGENAHCETITINGGTVRATGGGNGAGIGAGRDAHGGTIQITGGDVTAEGRDSSAGIGGGDASGSFADYSNIEISGGKVNATGNSKGAGIGGGEYGHASIAITGGEITANGGPSGGAGIGNGKDGSGSAIVLDYTDATAETISITTGSYKGTVTLRQPFKNSKQDPDKFRPTGSVSDLGKLAADPPLVAWLDADEIPTEVNAGSWAALQAAINDEQADERTIRLTGNITAGSGDTRIVIPARKKITIDLNGKTMNRGLANAQASQNGSVIYVERGATLTIVDGSSGESGKITGGSATKGGGILNFGTVLLKSGTITGNKSSEAGGGIYNAGTLTMSGGTISGNTADTWGGGIYLPDGTDAVLNLNGGEIKSNTCGNNGGGVHVSSKAFINVSGNPQVTNNKKGSAANNVNLADGSFIYVTGALASDAKIGMHMSYPTSGNITSGLKNRGTAGNFTSDESGYEIRIDGNGEAYLYRAPTYSVSSWEDLQNKVNSAANESIIQLSGDVIRTGQLTRIKIGENKRVTIDLAGHKLDRALTSKYSDGQVIEVFDGATLTIRDSVGGGTITRGYAKQGGGIYINSEATCIITGGAVTGNKADDDGGGIYVKGTLKMTGGAVRNNYADDNGGGIYVNEKGVIDLNGADVSYNTADDEGGGIKAYLKEDSRITNCSISYNKSKTDYGGGLFMDAKGRTLTITDTNIDHNSSDDDGAGIYLRWGAIAMKGGSLSENWSENDGGGAKITDQTTFTAEGVVINKNTAKDEEGGGIKNFGTTTLTNCRISNNKAKRQGGGIFNDKDGDNGVLKLYDCTVFGNNTGKDGGGVYSDYKLTLIGGSITGNTAADRGGGIYIGGDSKDTEIGGNLVVKDNGATGIGKEALLREGKLVVREKLTEGAQIGVTKDYDGGIGEFTKNYQTQNNSDSPSKYFFSPEGLEIARTDNGEAKIDSGWKNLRERIAAASSNDTISLEKDYTAPSGEQCLTVSQNITIDLNGHTLNRNQTNPPVWLEGPFGTGTPVGTAIYVQEGATLTLMDSTAPDNGPGTGTITGGYSVRGGGIHVAQDAVCTASNINLKDNKASSYGGGAFAAGRLTMTDCAVTRNKAEDEGGGIYSLGSSNSNSNGNVTLDHVTVSSNLADDDGGGMKLMGATNIRDSEVIGNTASDCSGGMELDAKGKTLYVDNTKFNDNSCSDDGAGIYLDNGRLEMSGGSISGNSAKNDSGGIKIASKTEFVATGVDISNNTAEKEDGGGFKNYGTTTLTNCTVSGNSAGKQGGGIFNDNDGSSAGDLTLNGCKIYGNSTASDGGGIYSDKKLKLNGDNVIGATTVDGKNVPGNKAANRGGGIFIGKDSDETKIQGQNKLTGNEAGTGADLYLRPGQKLTLTGKIDGTNIGIIDMDETGVFTKDYRRNHSEDPRFFFGTSAKAVPVEWNKENTEAMLHSSWPDLQALIDAAGRGESRDAAGHPETKDHIVTLDKHYTAGSDDDRLMIRDGHSVTIDLNGCVLNRNLASKDNDGHVIEVKEGSTLTIKDSTAKEGELGEGMITGGYSKRGGGIYINKNATVNIEGGVIIANRVTKYGGGIMNYGTLNMTGGAVVANSADKDGGGIDCGDSCSLNLKNATIAMNKAGDNGGGVSVQLKENAVARIDSCTITENSAADYGGGLRMDAKGRTLTIVNTTIDKNTSVDDGAGVYVRYGTINMNDSTIANNSSGHDGGGAKITKGSTFNATHVAIRDNKAIKEEGGGIKNYGETTLTSCTISGNSAGMDGGGIFNDSDDGSVGKMTLQNCTIRDNTSQKAGGGVYSDNKLNIIGGTISANNAQDKGGGVFIGRQSNPTGIKGNPVIKDNETTDFGNNLYLCQETMFEVYHIVKSRLELTGLLTDEADIHVDLEKGTGVLTMGYHDKNGEDDPTRYFTFAKGYDTKFTDGEVEICSGWPALKKAVESAENGATITLDKDYAAADSDDRIKIEKKNITIDLNGHTLNRNRGEKTGDGHVFEVFGGATLTIQDSSTAKTGTIMGGWSADGGGIYVNSNATLNLEGGTVKGNRGTNNGGGIYVGGTLKMTGGAVESNKATRSGGGIYVSESGTLNLEGGSVEKNEAGNQGGGIMINEGTKANVKGSPVVFGNRAAKAGTDIYLPQTGLLTVTGALAEEAKLGVAKAKNGTITEDYSRFNQDSDNDPSQYFVSTEGYSVYLEDGQATLGKKVYGKSDYTDPFISWNNQIGKDDALSAQSWMSGISGERNLNEINLPRSHDSGMNNVDEKLDGTAQMWFTGITGFLGGASLLTFLVAGVAAIFTGGVALAITGVSFAVLTSAVALNAAVPTDWTSAVSTFSDGRGADLAKTQRLYIDEQLRDGARVLDLRLNNRKKVYKFIDSGAFNGYKWEDDGKNLWICHGKAGGGTYQAQDPDDEFLSFTQVLEWSKEFLEDHPTETIIVGFTPETEDASQHRTIMERTRKILENTVLQINPSTSEPYLYKEPGSDDFFAQYTHVPKLADARGKIVIRTDDSMFQTYVGGYTDQMGLEYVGLGTYTNTPQELVAELIAEDAQMGTFDLPTDADTHFNDFWFWGLNSTGQSAGMISYSLSADPPHKNADYVNPRVIGDDKIFGKKKTGKYMGFVSMDTFEAKYAEPIWRTNYFNGLQYRTVTVKSGLDNPTYPDQTYQVLKGTKIEIPGNIYKELDELDADHYFDRWMVEKETGDSANDPDQDNGGNAAADPDQENADFCVPGDTYKVNEDVTFTANWLEEGKIPVQIRWKDGNDEDKLRPESLVLLITTNAGTAGSNTITLSGDQDWRKTVSVTGNVTDTDIVPNWEKIVVTSENPKGQDTEGQYSYDVTHEEGTGFFITLTHTPQKTTSISGTVHWEGDEQDIDKRPASVTIHLLRNGENVKSQAVTAGEDGGWSFKFADEPLYVNGEKVTYSITETIEGVAAERYESSIDGYSVVNTYIPEEEETVTVVGTVEWDDDDDVKGLRPETVSVTLMKADGEEVGNQKATQTDYGWIWSFENLPVTNEEGNPINYTITPEVVQGYSVRCETYPSDAEDPSESGTVTVGKETHLFRIVYTLKDITDEEKTPAEIDKEPKAIDDLIYTGEPQTLIDKGEASGGRILYALGDSAETAPDKLEFSTDLPTAMNAGTYNVWYYAEGNVMHTDTEPVCLPVTIAKAGQNIEADDVSGTAGDTDKRIEASVTGINGTMEGVGTLSYAVTKGDDIVTVNPSTGKLNFILPEDAAAEGGTAEVTITAAETDNYAVTEKTVTITVASLTHILTFYEDKEGTKVWKTLELTHGESLAKYATFGMKSEGTPDEDVLEKEGYTFAGWATEPDIDVDSFRDKDGKLKEELIGKLAFENVDGGIASQFDGVKGGKIIGDARVYPIWTRDSLKVEIRPGAPEGETVIIDEAQDLEFMVVIDEKLAMRYLKEAKRDGYVLDGWYTTGGVLWNGNDWKNLDYVTEGWNETAGWGVTPEYCDKYESGKPIIVEVKADRYKYYQVTLTARWTPNSSEGGDEPAGQGPYTITFDSVGGSPVDSITLKSGSEITPPADPTKEHYEFKGWSPALPKKMPANDLTVYATWTPEIYTMTFEANGGKFEGEGSPEQLVFTDIYNAPVTAPMAPTKEGAAFAGWKLKPSGSNPGSGGPAGDPSGNGNGTGDNSTENSHGHGVVEIPIYMPDSNPIYVAQWHNPGEPVQKNETPATCTEAGSYDEVTYCQVCGEELSRKTETIPPLGHDWNEPSYVWAEDFSTVTATSTCKRDEHRRDTSHEVRSETVTTSHDITRGTTCTENGQITYTAVFTGDGFETQTKKVEIEATGHRWRDDWIKLDDGQHQRTCKNDETHVQKADHIWDGGQVTSVATEDSTGVRTYTCTVCGAEKTETIPALGHDWGEPSYVWAADNSKVTATRTCKRDGSHVDSETAQTSSRITARATCTEKGEIRYTAVFDNKAFETQTKIVETAATDHDWGGWIAMEDGHRHQRTCKNNGQHLEVAYHNWNEGVITTEATENAEGSKTLTCTDCDATRTKSIPMKTHVHDLTKVNAKSATCIEDGNIEYWVCNQGENSCGEYFSDAEAKTEIEVEDTILPATGHDWGEWIDLEDGQQHQRTCGRDGTHMEISTHSWDEGEVTTKATETTEGVKTFTCKVCSATKTEPIPRKEHEHKLTKVGAKAATCTEDGNIEYWICDQGENPCRRYFSDAKAETEIAQAATVIMATGHQESQPVVENRINATCEEDGSYDSVVYCSKCGNELSRTRESIEATGHSWDGGVITEEATRTSEGVRTYTCTVCGATRTETIPIIPDHSGGTRTYHTITFDPNGGTGEMKTVSIASGREYELPECGFTPPEGKVFDGWTLIFADKTEEEHPAGSKVVIRSNTTMKARWKDESKDDDPDDIEDRTKQMGVDGTPFGRGAAIEAAEAALAGWTSSKDPAGTRYAPLKLMSKKQTKKAVTVKWKKASGTKKYIVYGAAAGSKNKLKRLKQVSPAKRALKVSKLTKNKKLKKAAYYKFMVIAVDKHNNVVSSSKIIHVSTKGSKKRANHRKVTVKAKVNSKGKTMRTYRTAKRITLKRGKATKLKSRALPPKKQKVKRYRGLRYESSNPSVLKVTSKGRLKARKKGKATLYVYAQNGVARKVIVKVK